MLSQRAMKKPLNGCFNISTLWLNHFTEADLRIRIKTDFETANKIRWTCIKLPANSFNTDPTGSLINEQMNKKPKQKCLGEIFLSRSWNSCLLGSFWSLQLPIPCLTFSTRSSLCPDTNFQNKLPPKIFYWIFACLKYCIKFVD